MHFNICPFIVALTFPTITSSTTATKSIVIFVSSLWCDACAVRSSWDKNHAKQLQHDYETAFQLWRGYCPRFWSDNPTTCVADVTPNMTALEKFFELLEKHTDECATDCQCHIACATVPKALEENWEPSIALFNFHSFWNSTKSVCSTCTSISS